ncbi:MAG: ABC transporter ATP-binding protein [Deltaproteobacteria bacterium]|nr:ABC transporter ATP-binding protein [Candidatus Anaeroferrophillus wilburensis]MBN2889016.1 ABC transporter ATP-binding protein [Deltaproteobacteria bacterium]
MLRLKSVNKAFGGLKVTNDVNFSIRPGEISAIIGPNGAGKTTLFNQITGFQTPDSGEIIFAGQNIVGKTSQDVVVMGIGRAFQIASLFPDQTVLDNVKIACLSHSSNTGHILRSRAEFQQDEKDAMSILESLGIDSQAHRLAYELAHGDQKLLDIGIALALRPRLLLLDEPTAGMSPEEREVTRSLIKKLWKEFDLTLVFIEHDMDMVFGIAETVRVLQQGALLAEGTPDEIRNNREVVTAYLGE